MQKISTILFIVFFILCGNILPSNVWADDAAMVMDLNGRVIYKTGEKAEKSVNAADFLYSEDRIYLDKSAAVVLIYSASGIREEISGPGTIEVGKIKSKAREKTIIIKRDEIDYLPVSAVINMEMKYAATPLRGSDSVLKPEPDKFKILNLCDTNIRSPNPSFCWQRTEEAKNYQLIIFNESDKQIFETVTKESVFVLKKIILDFGKEYRWTVSALAGEKTIAEAEGWFILLKTKQINDIEKSEKKIKSKFPDKNCEGMIALALLYQKHELFDETADVLRKLQTIFPENRNLKNWISRMVCE